MLIWHPLLSHSPRGGKMEQLVIRSDIMRRIKSTGNASTEIVVAKSLRAGHVTGWRRHAKVLGIRPDFVFRKSKIAVFVDGCFWHWCLLHCKLARLSTYWRNKIIGNYT